MVTVFARGDMDLICARITARRHEFMPPSLLHTQFEDLQELDPDEPGMTVDIAKTPEQIVDDLIAVMTGPGAVHGN
jgi:gluconokinase